MSGKIAGPPCIGFGDFFEDVFEGADDVFMGAGQTMASPQKTGLALTRRPLSQNPAGMMAAGGKTTNVVFKKLPIKKGTPSKAAAPQKKALVSAIDAGKRLIDIGKKAATRAKADQAKFKSGQRAPLVPLRPTAVRGDGTIVLGAVLPKTFTPVQKAAVQKHVQTVAKSIAATRRLAALAAKAQKVGAGTLDFSQKAALDLKKALAPKWKSGPTSIRGDFYHMLGAESDPNNPGFLTDGTPDPKLIDPGTFDPAAFDPYATTPDPAGDAGTGVVVAPDGVTVLYDPATDPMLTPVPTRGQVMSPEDALISWQTVPEDGVIYDGSRGMPVNMVGSWNVFHGKDKDQFGWGTPGFIRGSTDGGALIQWLYNAPEFGAGVKDFRPAGPNFQTTATTGAPGAGPVSADSLQRGWGPIIGNPKDPYFAGILYAIKDGVWFWQGVNAPKWATAEIDLKITQANKKIIDANRTAALVRAAQMMKDIIDAQEAQAKQDMQNALAQSAADTQSDIIQKQVDAQALQLDMQRQKAEQDAAVQQQQLDMQMAQQQSQMDAQMQAMQMQMMQQQMQSDAAAQAALIEQTQIWNEWAKQNPQEAMAQMQQDPTQVPVQVPGGGGGYMEPDFSDGNQGAMPAGYDPFAEMPMDAGGGYEGGYESGGYDFGDGGGEEYAESAEGD